MNQHEFNTMLAGAFFGVLAVLGVILTVLFLAAIMS